MNCVKLYSPLKTHLNYAYASDYMPFQSNGEVITGLFEYNETPYAHTANDKYIYLDPVYIYNIAKATTGAVQHFAMAGQTLSTDTVQSPSTDFRFYPNPAKDYLQLEFSNSKNQDFSFTITSLDGKLIAKTENQTRINISSLQKGNYLGTFKIGDQIITKKMIVE